MFPFSKKNIRPLLVFIFSFLGVFPIYSLGFCEEFQVLYQGIRPLGMGGAFMTLSNDENALFYNPAGLNDVKDKGKIKILNPFLAFSKDAVGFVQDLKDLEGTNTAQVSDLLNKNLGKHHHLKTSLFPSYYRSNLAFGILGQGTMDLEVRNPSSPEVVSDAKLDIGGLVGAAWGLWDDRLQMGVTAKVIHRQGIKKTFLPSDVVADFNPFEDTQRKTDFAFDLGSKFNFPFPFNPSVALVLQNISDLDFGELGEIPQQLNAGIGINPEFWILSSSLVFEVNDLTKNGGRDNDLYKRVHLGMEVRFPMTIALRAGLNQGYLTAGATLDFWVLQFGYATYAEELGTYAGQRGNRRHAVQLSLVL